MDSTTNLTFLLVSIFLTDIFLSELFRGKLKLPEIYITILLSFLIISCTTTNPTLQIMNLSAAKNAVQAYYESGEFDHECSKIIDKAILAIDGMNVNEKSAVIFDVDETALSNYGYTKGIGFGYNYNTWNEWQQKGTAPVISQTKRFYNYLVSRKIDVIFLTGREDFVRESTRRNLIEKGYSKFDTLIVRTQSENKISAAIFKSMKREELTKNGYDIIASIGDDMSDFIGGNTGYKIKLPNYLYLID